MGLLTAVGIYEMIVPTAWHSLLPSRVSDLVYANWPWPLVVTLGVLAGVVIGRLTWFAARQRRRIIELQPASRLLDRGTWAKPVGFRREGPIQWTGFDDFIAYTRGGGGAHGSSFFHLEAIKIEGTATAKTSIVSGSIRSLVTQERISMHVDGAKGVAAPVIPKGTHFTLRASLTPLPGITFQEFGRRFSCFHITVETDNNRYDLEVTLQDTADIRARLQQLEWEPIGEPSPFQPAT